MQLIIETFSNKFRKETNRLRAAKDEAKRVVFENFPHLFKDSEMTGIRKDNSGGS